MINQEFSSITLSSDAIYKDITGVVFTPLQRAKVKQIRWKGNKRAWKWLGIIPVFTVTDSEDVYQCYELFWDDRKATFDEIKDYVKDYNKYCIIDGELWRCAIVKEKHLHGLNKDYFFTSNEAAINRINEIKKFCEECGNTLR